MVIVDTVIHILRRLTLFLPVCIVLHGTMFLFLVTGMIAAKRQPAGIVFTQ